MAYGSVLSGALAGHIFGDGSRWNNTAGEPPEAEFPTSWECLRFEIQSQVKHLAGFVMSEGARYQDLVLATGDLPQRAAPTAKPHNLDGWAHMMRTSDRRFALLYFENGALRQTLEGMLPKSVYLARWFDPRTGRWMDAGDGKLAADGSGRLVLPIYPGGAALADRDWAMKLVAQE